ncbi:hypothetical protein NDU88_004330 [Pleurodeles waltl]|uniref:Prepronociceptin n=1 Tax=Pleurodeles waltl TaxID=8319 RepID=A0AAV7WV85_PLEWA|nr:hypothetical protein NDU88_004330 [Pleurodeles waltl]
MAVEAKVQQALRLLEEAGRQDLVRPEAAPAARPTRRAASGVAAAVLACSPTRRVTAVKKEMSLPVKGGAQLFGGRVRGVAGSLRLPLQAPIKKRERWRGRSRPLRKEPDLLEEKSREQSSSGDESSMEGTRAGGGREGSGMGPRLFRDLAEELALPASSLEGFMLGLGDAGYSGRSRRKSYRRGSQRTVLGEGEGIRG